MKGYDLHHWYTNNQDSLPLLPVQRDYREKRLEEGDI